AGFVEPAAVPHAASSLHPFDAAGGQCALDVVRVDIADRAFRDVGQGGDTRVRVEAPVEGRALMVEKVENRMASGSCPSRTGSSNVWRGRAPGHGYAALEGTAQGLNNHIHPTTAPPTALRQATPWSWRIPLCVRGI